MYKIPVLQCSALHMSALLPN